MNSVAPTMTNQPVLKASLRTERLVLRPAGAEDSDATWTYRRLPSVNEWLTGCPEDRDGYRALFTDPERLATTVIVELVDGPLIGDFMLRREDAWVQDEVAEQARGAQAELGWVLDPTHTGHGYATEAVLAMLRYSFDELGVRRVVANCFYDNDASWRLMERVGMRREAYSVRESLHRSGRSLDTVTYAVLRDERTDQPARHR
jgi:RimJ/RimL family protein N-acetyltransferase